MNVGNKIIALRTEHKMSQSELAFLLDVSRQTVSKWECNICDPEIGRIKQIASIFNVTTDYLLNNKIDNDVLNVKPKTNKIKNSIKLFVLCFIPSPYSFVILNLIFPYNHIIFL